jgi:hypothetical protein
MRENRTYGSEGGATQLNALFLPLSRVARKDLLTAKLRESGVAVRETLHLFSRFAC